MAKPLLTIALLGLSLGWLPALWAAQPVGLLLLEEGRVQVHRGREPQLQTLLLFKPRQSLRLFEGDRILTGAASRARVSFVEGGEEILLFSTTHLDLSGPDPRGIERRLKLSKGKVLLQVERKQGQVALTCLSARIEAQNARMSIATLGEAVRLGVLEGRASFSNLAYPAEPVRLVAGRWSQLRSLEPPSAPRRLSAAAQAGLVSLEVGQAIKGLPPLEQPEVRHDNLAPVRHENLPPVVLP